MKNTHFLQSSLWREINTKVFDKTVFDIDFLGSKCFGFVKEKSKGPLRARWYQLLGISLPDLKEKDIKKAKDELSKIKRDFHKNFSDMFFQLGFVNEISRFSISDLKKDDFPESVKQQREGREKFIREKLGIDNTVRENMPWATVKLDLSLPYEDIKKDFSSIVKKQIKKSYREGVEFEVATEEDWESFYKIWEDTAEKKGFSIIGKETFLSLRDFLLAENSGNLFLVKKDGEILNGGVYLFRNEGIYYLYGATNRNFNNLGGGYFLKDSVVQRGKDNGYEFLDMFGVSPTGYPSHPLQGVSKFKQGLGGEKIEYLGSYDMVFNKQIYKLYKTIRENI